MKIGMLGCGGIAGIHLEVIGRSGEARAVHVADANRERAEAVAKQYSVPRWSDDPQAVIADPEVEWVILCLPTFLHARWIQACAQAGKHVLTEKPLARTVAQAKEAIACCRAAGVRLFVNYQRRYSPAWQRAREVIQAGTIGRPVTWTLSSFGVRKDYGRGANNWMWDFEQGAGAIMDGSIHHFDFVQWISGRPEEMFARASRLCADVTSPTEAAACVRFASGDHLNFSVAWQSQDFGSGGAPFAAVGPKGTLTMTGDWGFTLRTERGEENFNVDANTLEPPGLGFRWLFHQQLLAIRDGCTSQPALVPGEEALASLWMAEQITAAGPQMGRYLSSGELTL